MLDRIYSSLICGATGAVVAFVITHSYYTEKVQRIYAEIEAGTRVEEIKAIEQQRQDEFYFQSMQNSEEGQALDAYAAINFKFNSLNSSSTSSDRLQLQDGDGSNSPAMPDTAGAPGTPAATCDCGRLRQTYNNLKQQCGLIAKERDELAVDRNELIQLYNQVRARYGNEIKDRVQKDL